MSLSPWSLDRPFKREDFFMNKTHALWIDEVHTSGSNKFPHMILYGPPGSGKRSLVSFILKNHSLGVPHRRNNVLTLEGPNHLCFFVIDVLRRFPIFLNSVLLNFLSFKSWNKEVKFLILFGAEKMTESIQSSLRRIMEKHYRKVRFIFITEHLDVIMKPLQSRCKIIRTKSPSNEELYLICDWYAKNHGHTLTDDIFKRVTGYSTIKSVNMLQTYLSKITPSVSKKNATPDWIIDMRHLVKQCSRKRCVLPEFIQFLEVSLLNGVRKYTVFQKCFVVILAEIKSVKGKESISDIREIGELQISFMKNPFAHSPVDFLRRIMYLVIRVNSRAH